MRKVLGSISLLVLLLNTLLTPLTYAGEYEEILEISGGNASEEVNVEEDGDNEMAPEFSVEEKNGEEESDGENIENSTGNVVEEGSGEVFEVGSGEIEDLTGESVVWDTGAIVEELTGFIDELTGFSVELTGEMAVSTVTGEETVVEEMNYNNEPILGEKTYNDVTVKVEALTGIFPEGTELIITPIKWWNLSNLKDKLVEEQEEVKEDTTVVAFDITFIYSGEEVQPKEGEKVKVTFDYSNNEDLVEADKNDNQEVKVYHIEDKDEKGNKLEDEEKKIKDVTNKEESGEEGIAVAEGESFSIYVLVTTDESLTSVNVIHNLDGGYWMEDHSMASKTIQYTCDNGSCTTTNRYKTPSKTGFMFMGWFDESGTTRRKGEAVDGMNVYAKWQEFGDLDVYIILSESNSGHYTLMDRNMGAKVIYDGNYSNPNEGSRGYYYQWGNNYGFDEYTTDNEPLSPILPETANVSGYSWINPYYSSFFRGKDDGTIKNWMSSIKKDLWGDVTNTQVARQGPCPDGYYIPNQDEYNRLLSLYNGLTTVSKEKLTRYLLMPPAGIRDRGFSVLGVVTNPSYYRYITSSWYGTDFTNKAVYFFGADGDGSVNLGKEWSSNGLSARCFMNNEKLNNKYNIYLNGGENAILTILSGVVQSFNVPYKNFYDFDGWYTSPYFEGDPIEVGSVLLPGSSLYAKWRGFDRYTITYDLHGGFMKFSNNTRESNILEYAGNTNTFTLKNPVKLNSVFVGWSGTNLSSPTLNVTIPKGSTGDRVYEALYECESGYELDENNDCVGIRNADGTLDFDVWEYGTLDFEVGGAKITMLDRNLGATTNDINDAGSQGFYYKWGNNYGFSLNHATKYGVTNERVSNVSGYGPGTLSGYYTSPDWIYAGDKGKAGNWFINANFDLWGDITDTLQARQGPCPNNYHIPSDNEIFSVIDLLSEFANTSTGMQCVGLYGNKRKCFQNLMKLPDSGYIPSTKNISDSIADSDRIFLWTSSDYNNETITAFHSKKDSGDDMVYGERPSATAMQVRCFKNIGKVKVKYNFNGGYYGDNIYSKSDIEDDWWNLNKNTISPLSLLMKRDNSTFSGWYLDSEFTKPFTGGTILPYATQDTTFYAKFDCNEGYMESEDGMSCIGGNPFVTLNKNSEYGTVSTGGFEVEYGTAVSTSGDELIIGGETVRATPNQSDAGYEYYFNGWGSTCGSGVNPVKYGEIIYKHDGAYKFDGTNYIKTETSLFSEDNYKRDFEISFDIVNFDIQTEELGSFVNALLEDQDRGYPGFVFRRQSSQGNSNRYEYESNNHKYNLYDTISNNINVKIKRENSRINVKFGNKEGTDSYDYGSFNQFFDVPVTIGASLTGEGTPFRYIKGILSGIELKYINTGVTNGEQITGNCTITANFSRVKRSYPVIFKNEDGTVLDEKTVEYGITPEYTGAIPTKSSDGSYKYIFTGWTPEITEVGGPQVYTATFDQGLLTYTVTFDAKNNGGTTLTGSIEVASGVRVELDKYTATPTDSSYQFIGWSENPNSSVILQTDPVITSDKTLYAVFGKEVSATFNANGNELNNANDNITKSCTVYNKVNQCNITTPTISNSITRTVVGYTTSSAGSTESNTGSNKKIAIVGGEVYYAQTMTPEMVLTGAVNGNNSELSSYDQVSCTLTGVYNGETQATSCVVLMPQITPHTNTQTVVGWNTTADSTTNNSSFNTNINKLTLTVGNTKQTWYAITKAPEVHLSITYQKGTGVDSIGENSSGCIIESTYNGNPQATTCTVKAPTITVKLGYSEENKRWKKVGEDDVKLPGATITLNKGENFVIYEASTNIISYTIEYLLNSGTVTEENPASYTVESGDITLNNPTREGYIFEGWSGTNLTEPTETVTIAQGSIGDRVYEANWRQVTHIVTYDAASHSGTIVGNEIKEVVVNDNDVIQLTGDGSEIAVSDKEGYQFIGWTNVLGGTEPITEEQIITSDVTFYPIFKKDSEQRAVTFSGNGATLNGNNGIEITIPCTIPAVYNTGIQQITCPITAPSIQREGYEILGYSIDKNYKNICAITGNQEIKISGNELYYAITKKNLTATFNKNGNTAQIKHGESETTESIIEESCSIWNQETECKVRTPLILPATGKTLIGYTTSTISSGENLTGENTEIILSTSPMSYYAWTQSTPQEVKVNYVYSTGVIQGATTENSCWTEVRYNGDENQTGCMITLPILQVREGYVAPKWYRTESEVVETDNENRAMFYYESSPITLTGKAEVSGTISYVVKHYFQMLENDVITNKYALNQSYTDVGLSGEVDTILILSGLKKEIEGFEYFKATVNGQPVNDIIDISQAIEYAETHQLTTPVEIKLLYTRNKYEYTLNQVDNVSTEGSTASNTNMYYGQMIVLSGAVTNDCYERSGWQGLPENVENTHYTTFPMPAGNVIITPTVEEKTYTIVFDKNAVEAEGTVSAMENVRCSAQVQLDSNKIYTRNGYEFKEWNTNSDGIGTGYVKDAMIATALTKTGGAIVKLYAQWTANTYKVTFNANGGAVSQIEKMVTYDQPYGVLPVPTREGYAFSGWYTQAEGGKYITGTTKVTRIADHTLYAQWRAETYVVTFDANSGVVTPETIEVVYNQPYGDMPTPNRTGYTFQGWYTAKDGGTQVNQSTQLTIANNHTLYAHWNVNSYTITYNLNGGELPIGKSNPEMYTIESGNIILNNPVREGYDFQGWSGTDLTELTTTVIISQGSTGNREYEANWKIKTYTITWMNSTGSLLEKDENVEYGSMPSYDGEEPTSGGNVQYTYSFSGWNPQTGMVVEDQVYTAVYNSIVNQYAVTFVDEDGTILKVSTNYDYNTPASDIGKPSDPTKVADAQYTYTFAGWNPGIHNVTGAQVYTATYDKTINKYKVLWKNRDGYVLETDENVEYGSKPKYDGNTPLSGETVGYQYRFAGWNPSITNETIIEGDTVYTATYESIKRKYQITWNDYDDQVIDITEVEYGVIPTHANPLRTGYQFNSWDPIPVEVVGPTSYKATYTIKQYTVTPEKGVGVDDILGGGTYDYGTEIVLTGVAKEGYHFEGGVKIKEFNVDVPAQNITVKINAQPNIYYVHFKNNGGEGVMNDQAFTYDQEQALTPNAYIRNGFTFVSWTDGEGGIYKDKAVVKNLITSGTINLIAQWIEGDVPGPTPPIPEPSGGGSSGGGRTIDKNTDDKEHDSAEDKQQEKDVKDDQTKKDLIIQTGGDIKQITGDSSVIIPEPIYNWTEEELTAYKFAYKYGITTLAPEYAAMPDEYVVRGHMAKMVVNYALNVLHRKLPDKLPKQCKWKDGANAWESKEIKDYAEKACALGIMGIDMNYFQPNKYVTRAQFGTIIGRLLRGKLVSKPYYVGHLERLKQRGIMTQIENPENRIEIRKWAWLMFMRMEKYQ